MTTYESRADSGKRGKVRHRGTKPKRTPVTVTWVHPRAIATAQELARGRDVHVVYDGREGCMWVMNGAK